jgi:hypothetical protein
MSGLEYKNIERLKANPLLFDDERAFLRGILKDFGWAHPLTEAVIAEISKIRADCATQHRRGT